MGDITNYHSIHGRITEGSEPAGVTLVQKALVKAGAVLTIDGDWGPITEQAVKRFQAAHRLPPLGWVGTHTCALLDEIAESSDIVIPPPAPSILSRAPWLAQMRAITGTKELPGNTDSPIIMLWNRDIIRAFPEFGDYPRNYTHDSVPWCGLCMAGCMARCTPPISPPFGSSDTGRYLFANSWAHWKGATALAKPITGCVMVFSRTGGGHVSLLEKLVGDVAYIRGGNQSDMVNVAKKDLSTLVGAFWPPGWPVATDIVADITNSVSAGSEA
jgi:uncharacterized protein (TIGR02594 family)